MSKELIVIAGPTAIGKTAISVEIAETTGTEIISSDSRQIYREMSVGTAVPSPEFLRKSQTSLHHGPKVSIENYNASMYENEVLDLLRQSV